MMGHFGEGCGGFVDLLVWGGVFKGVRLGGGL